MLHLSNIFGQDRAIQTIRQAYLAERLPHGLIFAGPVGVGKGTAARALGQLFLCPNPRADRPCDQCESCRLFKAGSHPDYHVIVKELIRYHDKTGKSKGIDLSIHVIRPELIDPANRKSAMGGGKVFIIEQAELMNLQAQNAMLKTLEEPAGRTLIILLTDQPDSLLATIRSRCQIVVFSPLDGRIVRRELENRGIAGPDAADAARLADGSLGVAIRWLEDGVVEAARDLISQMENLLAGRVPDDLSAWFKQAADAYADKQLRRDPLASKDSAMRRGLSIYLHIAAHHFRRRLNETADAEELEQSCAAIDAIARAELYLDSNVNIPLLLQQFSLSLDRQFERVGRD